MVPVGPKKIPLLAYIIRLVAHHGIDRISLLTGYRSHEIEQYFGDGSHYGVKLSYSEDVEGRTGSLNAVSNALRRGAVSKCRELLVYYGDVLSDLDITRLIGTHRRENADATLVLARGYTLPVGVADVKNGTTVTSLKEKPELELSVTTGCMVLGQKAMERVKEVAGPKKTDLMSHFVPALLKGGGKVAAFYTEGIWFDVGTITSFEKLNEEITKHRLAFMS